MKRGRSLASQGWGDRGSGASTRQTMGRGAGTPPPPRALLRPLIPLGRIGARRMRSGHGESDGRCRASPSNHDFLSPQLYERPQGGGGGRSTPGRPDDRGHAAVCVPGRPCQRNPGPKETPEGRALCFQGASARTTSLSFCGQRKAGAQYSTCTAHVLCSKAGDRVSSSCLCCRCARGRARGRRRCFGSPRSSSAAIRAAHGGVV